MLKKEQKKAFLGFLAKTVGIWLLKCIYLTCKKTFHGDKLPKESCLLATWHGEMLMMPFCYNHVRNTNKNVAVLASGHGDGQLIGSIMKKITSGKIIAGSSSKNGLKALFKAIKIVKDEQCDLAIAPDGPRGPRHSVAGGIVLLSQKTNTPIVTFNCIASSFWQFKSWDKMFLPKPFSRLDFFISKPFLLTDLELEVAKQKIQKELNNHAAL